MLLELILEARYMLDCRKHGGVLADAVVSVAVQTAAVNTDCGKTIDASFCTEKNNRNWCL